MNPADTLLQIEERLLDEAPSHGLPLDVVQDYLARTRSRWLAAITAAVPAGPPRRREDLARVRRDAAKRDGFGTAEERHKGARKMVALRAGKKELPRAKGKAVEGFTLGSALALGPVGARKPRRGIVLSYAEVERSPVPGRVPVWAQRSADTASYDNAEVELWPTAEVRAFATAREEWLAQRFAIEVDGIEERYDRRDKKDRRVAAARTRGLFVHDESPPSPPPVQIPVPTVVLRLGGGEGEETAYTTLDAILNTRLFEHLLRVEGDRSARLRPFYEGDEARWDFLAEITGDKSLLDAVPDAALRERAAAAVRRGLSPQALLARGLSLAPLPPAPAAGLFPAVDAARAPAPYERSIRVNVRAAAPLGPLGPLVAHYSLDALVLLYPENPALIGELRAAEDEEKVVQGAWSYQVLYDELQCERADVVAEPLKGDDQILLWAAEAGKKGRPPVVTLAALIDTAKLPPFVRGQIRRLHPGQQLAVLDGKTQLLVERCSDPVACRPLVAAGAAPPSLAGLSPSQALAAVRAAMEADAQRLRLPAERIRTYFAKATPRWLRLLAGAASDGIGPAAGPAPVGGGDGIGPAAGAAPVGGGDGIGPPAGAAGADLVSLGIMHPQARRAAAAAPADPVEFEADPDAYADARRYIATEYKLKLPPPAVEGVEGVPLGAAVASEGSYDEHAPLRGVVVAWTDCPRGAPTGGTFGGPRVPVLVDSSRDPFLQPGYRTLSTWQRVVLQPYEAALRAWRESRPYGLRVVRAGETSAWEVLRYASARERDAEAAALRREGDEVLALDDESATGRADVYFWRFNSRRRSGGAISVPCHPRAGLFEILNAASSASGVALLRRSGAIGAYEVQTDEGIWTATDNTARLGEAGGVQQSLISYSPETGAKVRPQAVFRSWAQLEAAEGGATAAADLRPAEVRALESAGLPITQDDLQQLARLRPGDPPAGVPAFPVYLAQHAATLARVQGERGVEVQIVYPDGHGDTLILKPGKVKAKDSVFGPEGKATAKSVGRALVPVTAASVAKLALSLWRRLPGDDEVRDEFTKLGYKEHQSGAPALASKADLAPLLRTLQGGLGPDRLDLAWAAYQDGQHQAEADARRMEEQMAPAALRGKHEALAIFQNLREEDEAKRVSLALAIEQALRERAPANWKGDPARETAVRNVLYPLLGRDRAATEALFEVLKNLPCCAACARGDTCESERSHAGPPAPPTPVDGDVAVAWDEAPQTTATGGKVYSFHAQHEPLLVAAGFVVVGRHTRGGSKWILATSPAGFLMRQPLTFGAQAPRQEDFDAYADALHTYYRGHREELPPEEPGKGIVKAIPVTGGQVKYMAERQQSGGKLSQPLQLGAVVAWKAPGVELVRVWSFGAVGHGRTSASSFNPRAA